MSRELQRSEPEPTATVDIAVIGGGPAGLAAAMWAARYRRRVVLFDSGQPRNRPVRAVHGYLGLEGIAPLDLIDRAREDLGACEPYLEFVSAAVDSIERAQGPIFHVTAGHHTTTASRIILCTGVEDVLPDIAGFDQFYGTSVFTCPSCDGYEAQNRSVVVIGDDESVHAAAVGMLDWSSSVTVVTSARQPTHDVLEHAGITSIVDEPAALVGDPSTQSLRSLRLRSGAVIDCDMVFCNVSHRLRGRLVEQLGCKLTSDGVIEVDDENRTSVPGVYAAGDITPGPQLVQIAAAKGAVAGIAAAVSLRGKPGATSAPTPAPEPDRLLATAADRHSGTPA